jgi:cobalt-zinc-cadmium efflux system protein
VLVQSAPPDVDLVRLESDLGKLPDVVDVHDLHVWTLTSGMEAMSAHLTTVDAADGHGVLDAARSLVSQRYAITHATFQVEPECHDCDDPRW